MRRSILVFLFIAGSACVERNISSAQTSATGSKSSPAPIGWVAYSKPTEDELRCANYSKFEWRVSLDNKGDLQIRSDGIRDHQDPLPPQIRSRNVAVGSKEDRHVIRVNDGWLVGMDIGEFGGGLWWFSDNGKRNKKLSSENVVGFAATSKGVLVFVGLSHMSLDNGNVLRFVEKTGGDQKLEVLANLSSAPKAIATESPDVVIVLTGDGLVRVTSSGEIANLFNTEYGLLYPNSMTLSSSGVIHIGMRHFLTRLTPAGNTYNEEWFVRADCPKFTTRDLDCVCVRR